MSDQGNIYILGISAFYHDSAACLIKDGQIIAAAQEERFTRVKHDASFPTHAIRFCLEEAGITSKELSYVGYYEKPFIKFERILLTYLTFAPLGLCSFLKAMPLWLKKKIFLKDFIRRELDFDGEIIFTEHHESHAASAFYPSPFQESAILTMDGVGEWATSSIGSGEGNAVSLHSEMKFPHSLGLLYSAFTYYTGFRVNSGEYKLMGLAPYGQPKYADLIRKELMDIKEDGSFKLNMNYFNYCAGLTMTNRRFHNLFGGPPRRPETEIRPKDMDIARSIQDVTEEIMLKMAKTAYEVTRKDNLCLAGGVALNCVGNGRILREGPFKNVWIQPAAGDAGGALGSALFIWYRYLNHPRKTDGFHDSQSGSYLGGQYADDVIEAFLKREAAQYEFCPEDVLPRQVAEYIADQKVVGLFNGRMEFGPRALGGRSILADARSERMQSILNSKIKFRESFRPFAPSVLEEKASDYFDLTCPSPYMLLTAPIRENQKNTDVTGDDQADILKTLSVRRSSIPAVTHVDYSARVQTVSDKTNPCFYKILQEFDKKTGCPVVINTSFNVRGEPIVGSPEDAYRCFMCTDMDYLVMGHYICDKTRQPNKDKFKKESLSLILD